MDEIICGRNSVFEALRSGNKTINKILLSKQARGSIIAQIIKLARQNKIPLHHVPASRIDSLTRENSQGIVAELSSTDYVELDDLLESALKNTKPCLVLLDNIVDPHNVGAIIRSAVSFGANGIIIPKWRAAGLTETVSRTSAGAIEHIPVSRVSNIAETISYLKEKGISVIGAEADGKPLPDINITFPIALVIGSEGEGLRNLVKSRCNEIVSIPQTGLVSSLNASCAAAVILYEIYLKKIDLK